MTYKVMNVKDLINGNWSADFHVRKDEGKNPYIKSEGGLLVEIEAKRSIPKNAIYLLPEQVAKYNEITLQINNLQEQRKKIIE